MANYTYPGRGGWKTRGMPDNGTGFYQLLSPVQVGAATTKLDPTDPNYNLSVLDYKAVHYGVKALQHRLNKMGYLPALVEDGHFGTTTHQAALWAQRKLGVVVDGQIGPRTSAAMFWPSITYIARHTNRPTCTAAQLAQAVGGIASHESIFDPGAVGQLLIDDLGLVQINGPANPLMTFEDCFDYAKALTYCANRINAAYGTYQRLDYAVASYFVPAWAEQWAKTGIAPNPEIVAFVDYVLNWKHPS